MRTRKLPLLAATILLFGVAAGLVLLFGQQPALFQTAHLPRPAAPPPPPARTVTYDHFGIEQHRFETIDRKIERNETFAHILSDFDVPYEKVVELAETARPVFDVRYLRAGQSLRVYRDDSLQSARYLVYQRDPVNYVVFELGDSLGVYEGQRPVVTERRVVSGVINGSLYATLDEQGADPRLAARLAEVYAWQIDFFRIQKGDFFSAVYEEKLVDGQPVELGRILAARFNHVGKDFYGFRFEETATEGAVQYYDDAGNSLRKAFLKAPLKYERISSRYTLKRFHPVQKRWKAHLGTDYAAATGTPIYAVSDGTVLEATFKKANGNYVKIRHNGTYTTGYLHMSRIAKGIRPGTHVQQGQVIGYVGSTGLATGPHLCYRFWKNGQQVDPLKEEFPSANPIPDGQRAAFEALRDDMMRLLDGAGSPAYAAADSPGGSTTM